jgi:hypothetical protein
MEYMDTPIFALGKNKNHLYDRRKKVRALFIWTENKDKKQKIKHTIIEKNCILCIIFHVLMKP